MSVQKLKETILNKINRATVQVTFNLIPICSRNLEAILFSNIKALYL